MVVSPILGGYVGHEMKDASSANVYDFRFLVWLWLMKESCLTLQVLCGNVG